MLADFPRLTTYGQGYDRRMNAVMAGRGKGRVDLVSAIKKFVRHRYPDFTFSIKAGDELNFEKNLSANLKIVLTFERIHHFGLGKAFTVHLSCEAALDGERFRWKHSLFPFFDREQLGWTYGLRDNWRPASTRRAGSFISSCQSTRLPGFRFVEMAAARFCTKCPAVVR